MHPSQYIFTRFALFVWDERSQIKMVGNAFHSQKYAFEAYVQPHFYFHTGIFSFLLFGVGEYISKKIRFIRRWFHSKLLKFNFYDILSIFFVQSNDKTWKYRFIWIQFWALLSESFHLIPTYNISKYENIHDWNPLPQDATKI